DLLRDIPDLHPDIPEGLAQHHEREDGSGYPNRLTAAKISLFGRMAGIVDVFAAITNVRPYGEPLSALDTLRKLARWSGNLFHKPLVEQFIQAIGVFPVGSLVELSNGEVAVVIRQSRVRRLQPRVLVICGKDKLPMASFRVLDLLYQPDRDSERVHIMRGLPAGAYGLDSNEYYLS
ncbi:MAG: HD-GYP domain-containing protein, partial [Acidobacteriota bacterium]